jgi:hypothetical protein
MASVSPVNSSTTKRKLIMEDSSESAQKVHCTDVDTILQDLRSVMGTQGLKKLQSMYTAFLESSYSEVHGEEGAEEFQVFLEHLQNILPLKLRVIDFTGDESTIQLKQTEFWNLVSLHAEREKLSEVSSLSTILSNFIKFWNDYRSPAATEEALDSNWLESTGRTKSAHADIYTCTTTATPITGHAVVPFCKESRSLFSTLREVSQLPPSQSGISHVSSYISAREGGNQRTYSLTTEEQPFLLKMRCYKTQDLEGVPERDQWKKAYADITMHFSATSQVHQRLEQLFGTAASEVLEAGGSVWEKKV